MDIYLYNTLTSGKDLFTPIKPGKVSMYHCGPTVYGYAHIGNLRAYIFADILRRTFEYNKYIPDQVINITDIGHLTSDGDEGEDKMTKALLAAGKELSLESLKKHADFYTEQFISDMGELNIETPQHLPKASDHISDDISLISKLEKKGFAYTTSDGVYFDTEKDLDYGKLGKSAKEEDSISRIGVNSEKKNPRDFCLWKFDSSLGWQSPWGQGFPGWHIECSAMSMKYLGDTFDIHTGGIDHIPVHHNNEIAQSESATGKPFAHFWLHGAFVNINGGKIAKSVGNTYYLRDLKDKGISPLAYRYWLLTAHYRTLVNFTEESVKGAQTALERLYMTVRELAVTSKNDDVVGTIDIGYQAIFHEAINDDLNTAKALATAWDLIKDPEISASSKLATLFDFDRVFGLNLKTAAEESALEIPQEVYSLIEQRNEARKVKDWKASDDLRLEIESLGYDVKDTNDGTTVIPKR